MGALREAFDGLLGELTKAALHHYGERLVALAVYGSVGRGVPRPDSDVDLLVVARSLPLGRLQRVKEFEAVELALTDSLGEFERKGIFTCISPVFKTPEEVRRGSPLFLDMTEDVQVLYEEHGFLSDYLAGLRQRLERLGSRRVWRGNMWYWDLKPDYKPGEDFSI